MRKRTIYYLSGFLLGLAALSFWSCYPSRPSNISDPSLVVTMYDPQFNFNTVHTYALPDTVFDLAGSGTVTHDYDALILATVETKMNGLGYTRELDAAQNGADVVLVISISKQTTTYVDFSWYDYWGLWPGWTYWGLWDSSWGISYPWPPIEAFVSGSVFIEMVDPKARDLTNKKLPVRWSGVMNGQLGSSSTITSDQIVSGVNQCFAQSPYLGK